MTAIDTRPHPLANHDDPHLVHEALSGNGAAFAELYRRHILAVTRYCHRRCGSPHDAADLAAEAFAEALLHLDRFDADRGRFLDWVYGIARNKWRRWCRTGAVEQRARQRLGIRTVAVATDDTERICDAIDAHTYRQQLTAHLHQLPDKLAAVIQLRVIEERTYPDIAATLGISEAAARKRLSRGLDRLASRLEPRTSRDHHGTSDDPTGPDEP